MKRQIKFRGKRIDNQQFVTGDLIQTKWGCYILQANFVPSLSIQVERFIEVIPETVGQFTGLKDKNGVEIFEGDVVKTNAIESDGIIEYAGDVGSFIVINDGGWDSIEIVTEVIGTIHDIKPAT